MSQLRIQELRNKAAHARQLADMIGDQKAAANLRSYAVDLEGDATKLETQTLPPAALDSTVLEPSTGPEAIAAIKSEPDAEPKEGGG